MGEIPTQLDFGTGFTTGGGFSNFNPRPSYQDDVVEEYLSIADLPPPMYFNPKGRAYPDISAIGHNLLMFVGGIIEPVDGTSASAPIAAGLLALLNDIRMNTQQQPFGFINPWIYQTAATFPAAFYDVVVGNNRCNEAGCCPYGFNATVGWDPTSGLGTPDFSVLMQVVFSESPKGISSMPSHLAYAANNNRRTGIKIR